MHGLTPVDYAKSEPMRAALKTQPLVNTVTKTTPPMPKTSALSRQRPVVLLGTGKNRFHFLQNSKLLIPVTRQEATAVGIFLCFHHNIKTFWSIVNIIHIMNVYECNGANMFMSWKMECSIQWGGAELNGTFQLSTNEHIRTIARMKNVHYLFYITSK